MGATCCHSGGSYSARVGNPTVHEQHISGEFDGTRVKKSEDVGSSVFCIICALRHSHDYVYCRALTLRCPGSLDPWYPACGVIFNSGRLGTA